MDTTIEKFAADFPELFDKIIKEGIRAERERVMAHINAARGYDSLEEAADSIEDGTPATSVEQLHDRYAAIEDERDREDAEAERKFGIRSG